MSEARALNGMFDEVEAAIDRLYAAGWYNTMSSSRGNGKIRAYLEPPVSHSALNPEEIAERTGLLTDEGGLDEGFSIRQRRNTNNDGTVFIVEFDGPVTARLVEKLAGMAALTDVETTE